MDDELYLITGQDVPAAQDYQKLKVEGTALIQQMAGDVWTDYNEHDPGVTILEQVCYALTELGYRAALPVEDLLADAQGRIETQRQALHIPRRILPCNPVTPDDYRKLFIDRVPGVANAWVAAYRAPSPEKQVGGLYDLWLYAPKAEHCHCDGPISRPDPLEPYIRQAIDAYSQSRNLCEDLRSVTVLAPVKAEVRGIVNLQDDVASDRVLAELLFSLGNMLAPEIHRHSLDDMLARGLAPGEIFQGPLLRHGFIDSADLQPLPVKVVYQDVLRAMARTPGVKSLRGVMFRIGASSWIGPDGEAPIPTNCLPQLDVAVGSPGFGIRLFRHGIECKPDPRRVAYELGRLWNDWRREYPLAPAYKRDFPVPEGAIRPWQAYEPLQYGFPNVYGVNANGVPQDAPPLRQAQAKQLQGYLLMFDQLMADFFAQLAHARDLFSIEAVEQTYFWESLWNKLTDPRVLLGGRTGYEAALARLVAAGDDVLARRNLFLDFMLALYAEQIDPAMLVRETCDCRISGESERRLVTAKTELLRHVVFCTRDRGRAFNYRAVASPRNVSGMEVLSRIQLGLPVDAHRPLADLMEDWGLGASDGTLAVDATPQLTEGLLRASASPGNFRVVAAPSWDDGGRGRGRDGDRDVVVQWREPSDGRWRPVSRHDGVAAAEAAIERLQTLLRGLSGERQQFYVVEHVLLRYGRGGPGQQGDFPYSFTLTIVQPQISGAGRQAFEQRVKDVVRENVPSHLVADFLFLTGPDLCRFETLYWDWRRALRAGSPKGKVVTSTRLRLFLQRFEEQP